MERLNLDAGGDDEARQGAPFWFVIPVRAIATTQRWEQANRLLRNCLSAVLNQTDGRFRVLLSCTDAPDLGDIDDPRIEVITHAHAVPQDFAAMTADKHAKIRLAGAEIRRRGGGYVMRLDSDDLVSARLVEHVLRDDNRAGYYVEEGYVFYSATKRLERLSGFYRRCGSSYVVYHRPDQLPADKHDETCLFGAFRNHRLARETAQAHGIALAELPFPAAVYLLETGTNMSLGHPKIARWTARARQRMAHIGRQIEPRRVVPEALRHEFALTAHL